MISVDDFDTDLTQEEMDDLMFDEYYKDKHNYENRVVNADTIEYLLPEEREYIIPH